MATLVSTGQLTIVDNNDAKTISAIITSNIGTQQVFTKDESTAAYSPNFVVSPFLILTARVYISGLTEAQVWGGLTSKKFTLSALETSTAITSADTNAAFVANDGVTVITANNLFVVATTSTSVPSTLTVKGNLLDGTGSFPIFFHADYTDPSTGLSTHIAVQVNLSGVKTGTNAVFILTRGTSAIEQGVGSTKNVTAIAADLLRAGVVDTSGLTYKWYEGATQISTSMANHATKYGIINVASPTIPTATTANLGATNIPLAGAGNANNTLVISETAVLSMGTYRVDITDAVSKTYSQYFTVYDISDPYEVKILGTDKLQNGAGSTSLTPAVYYGGRILNSTEQSGYTFNWRIYDRNNKQGAFVDTAKISTAGGAAITVANGTGISATITYGGTSYAFVAGDVIKVLKSDGTAYFYEVASSITNVVTIRTPSTNTWLNFTNYPAPTGTADFTNGKLFGCYSVAGAGVKSTTGSASLLVTGDDIDVKASITCEASRP